MSDVNVHSSMTSAPGRYPRPTAPDSKTIPSFANKSITIIPIPKISNDSAQIMSQDKKEIKFKMCPSKLSDSSSNKISNEVFITPINNKEDKIISMLKKLPEISFNVVESKSAFKVPDIPKTKKKSLTHCFTPERQINTIFEKKVPFQSQDKNIIDLTGTNSYDENTLKRKQKPDVIDNIPLLKTKNIQEIKKKPVIISNKKSLSIKENIQRTSTPKKLSKKPNIALNTKLNDLTNILPAKQILNFSTVSHGKKQSLDSSLLIKTEIKTNESLNEGNTARTNVSTESQKTNSPAFCSTNLEYQSNDLKNIQPTKQNDSSLNVSHEIKQNSVDIILNKTEIKTDESLNEDYTLMDISTDGQINIVPAFRSTYLINENVSNNENIILGTSKESEISDILFETTEGYGREISSNFSNLSDCVKTLPEANVYNSN